MENEFNGLKTHRVVGLNGGPRKNWNTATLLSEALKGAASQGAETKLIHLYDLDYKGCVSCFYCKTKENYLKGVCAQKDGLTEVLELLSDSTGLIMGSPIYLSDVTGALRSFIERYLFINLAYDPVSPSVLENGPAVGLIYTMNIPREYLEPYGYASLFKSHANLLTRLRGPMIKQLTCCDTLQFTDYGKYHAPLFDENHKKEVREKRFPEDLAAAYQMGVELAQNK
ncbi:MAG: flavodoxin family protein [Deltaproteobacteria bacterium]|jgi:multimeric flavodoxin WrbA|nr:flavodoxin family protein [Deltaproteobacteria bacterium]